MLGSLKLSHGLDHVHLPWITGASVRDIILTSPYIFKLANFYHGQNMTTSAHHTTDASVADNINAATNALKKFRVIYGTVRQHFRDVEQSCGISGSQLWLLQEIHRTQNIGVSELANRLSIHQSTCSQLVDKLAKAKLVTKIRSEQDQRRVGLCITQQAMAILAKAPSPAEGVLPEALNAMPKDVLLQLDSVLEKVIKQLGVRSHTLETLPLSDM